MTRPQKILIIDNDETSLFIAQNVLKRAAATAQVQTAANGPEALAIIRAACQQEQCPELVVVEINMPDMDGFEFIATFRQSLDVKQAAIQIVLVSSNKYYWQLAQEKEYPDVHYIEKPLTSQKLAPFLA